jgi:RNA polymerase sigma factor (sigma-70 family)
LSDFAIQRVFTNEQKMTDSRKLLKEYVSSRSQPAFRELVGRYVNLVHSVALRLASGDTLLAEDVTQIVFADLAAMAPKLPERVLLGGWLHQHTCFVTNRTLRTERRRRIRERQAAEMNSQQDHTEANLARIAPILDEAIGRLGTSDRTAIILRYFEQYDLRSVGEALGTTEDAAQKRVDRALEKLHVLLKHRGATLSAAALGTALASEAVTAAPAGLAGSVAGAALASVAAGGGTAATLVKLMTMTKIKVGILSVIAVAGVATPLAIQYQSQARLREENQGLRQQAGQLDQVAVENERLSNLVVQAKGAEPLSREQMSELLRLRGEVGRLRRESKELETLQAQNRQLRRQSDESPSNQGTNTSQPVIMIPPNGPARVVDASQLSQSKGKPTFDVGFQLGSGRDAIVRQLEQIHATTILDSPELVRAELEETPNMAKPLEVELNFMDGKLSGVNYILPKR